jgi:hypothetical protein
MHCGHPECCSPICAVPNSLPEKNVPFHLSEKALEQFNIILDLNRINPVIPTNDEEVGIMLRLNKKFPNVPAIVPVPKSELILADGTLFNGPYDTKSIYPVFFAVPGTIHNLVKLTLKVNKNGCDVAAFHFVKDDFRARVHVMENVSVFVPEETTCQRIVEKKPCEQFSLTRTNLDGQSKLAFFVLPANTKILSEDCTSIIPSPADKRIRFCSGETKFDVAIGTKIAFGKINVTTNEVISNVTLDMRCIKFD